MRSSLLIFRLFYVSCHISFVCLSIAWYYHNCNNIHTCCLVSYLLSVRWSAIKIMVHKTYSIKYIFVKSANNESRLCMKLQILNLYQIPKNTSHVYLKYVSALHRKYYNICYKLRNDMEFPKKWIKNNCKNWPKRFVTNEKQILFSLFFIQ